MIWNIFVALEMTFDISLSKIFFKNKPYYKIYIANNPNFYFYKDVEKNMCVNKSYKHRHKSVMVAVRNQYKMSIFAHCNLCNTCV